MCEVQLCIVDCVNCVNFVVDDDAFGARVVQMSSWLGEPRVTLSDIQEHSCSTKSKKECGTLSCFDCDDSCKNVNGLHELFLLFLIK